MRWVASRDRFLLVAVGLQVVEKPGLYLVVVADGGCCEPGVVAGALELDTAVAAFESLEAEGLVVTGTIGDGEGGVAIQGALVFEPVGSLEEGADGMGSDRADARDLEELGDLPIGAPELLYLLERLACFVVEVVVVAVAAFQGQSPSAVGD